MKNLVMIMFAFSFLVRQDLWAAGEPVELGQSSLSLQVTDINKSKDFYEKLGFKKIAGDIKEKWLILKNPSSGSVVGIFQDHFKERFRMTYNPKDVRYIQRQLKERGIQFVKEADGGTGPAHAILKDPDGNVILLDQHN